MRLRLLPQPEDAYFDLFEAAAANLRTAAVALLEMLGDLTEARRVTSPDRLVPAD